MMRSFDPRLLSVLIYMEMERVLICLICSINDAKIGAKFWFVGGYRKLDRCNALWELLLWIVGYMRKAHLIYSQLKRPV